MKAVVKTNVVAVATSAGSDAGSLRHENESVQGSIRCGA